MFSCPRLGSTFPNKTNILHPVQKLITRSKNDCAEITRTPAKPSRFRPHFPTRQTPLGLIAHSKLSRQPRARNGRLRHRDKSRRPKRHCHANGVRDVPVYDQFGDVAQISHPSVTLGYLAALTQNVALGSAGYVSPCASRFSPPKKPHRRNKSAAAASCSVWPAATVPPNTRLCRRFQQPRRTLPRSVANHPPPDAGKIPRVQ